MLLKNHRIQIYRFTHETNNVGDTIHTKHLIYTLWADSKYISFDELIGPHHIEPIVKCHFTIRYLDDIDAHMFVVYKDEEYVIDNIDMSRGHGNDITIQCTKRQVSGL